MSSEKFSNSLQTLALLKAPNFMSAFPGKIIFGEANCKGYVTNNFFVFDHGSLIKLYNSIVEITKFLTSNNERQSTKSILDNENISYFWVGKTLHKSATNNFEKLIIFAIEDNGERTFELRFSIPELDNFYCALTRSILMILCLKDIQYDLMYNASLLTIDNILLLKSDRKRAKQFVLTTFTSLLNDNEFNVSNCIELLHYYNDILVITHKLSQLCNVS
jgi:hypothetical protein